MFAQIDAPALMALPVQPWEWAVFKTVRVHIDSHVEFEGHRYSVPNALVGLALELLRILRFGKMTSPHAYIKARLTTGNLMTLVWKNGLDLAEIVRC